jgi:hypothetical protein
MKLELFRQIFRKNTPISSFIKIQPIGAELFREDGQTDVTKLIVALRIFADARNIYALCAHRLLFVRFV